MYALALANGRHIKCLTVVGGCSRACVYIATGGEYVARLLDQAAQFRGYPRAIRTNQGPAFNSRALIAWAVARSVRHWLNDGAAQRRTPTSRASTASSATNVLVSRGAGLWPKLGTRSLDGGATTTRCARTVPWGDHWRSSHLQNPGFAESSLARLKGAGHLRMGRSSQLYQPGKARCPRTPGLLEEIEHGSLSSSKRYLAWNRCTQRFPQSEKMDALSERQRAALVFLPRTTKLTLHVYASKITKLNLNSTSL